MISSTDAIDQNNTQFVFHAQVNIVKQECFDETKSEGNNRWEDKSVYLKLRTDETSCVMFLDENLPELTFDRPTMEVIGLIKHPIHKACRFSLSRPTQKFPHIHLFVMTRNIERELLNCDKKEIELIMVHESRQIELGV